MPPQQFIELSHGESVAAEDRTFGERCFPCGVQGLLSMIVATITTLGSFSCWNSPNVATLPDNATCGGGSVGTDPWAITTTEARVRNLTLFSTVEYPYWPLLIPRTIEWHHTPIEFNWTYACWPESEGKHAPTLADRCLHVRYLCAVGGADSAAVPTWLVALAIVALWASAVCAIYANCFFCCTRRTSRKAERGWLASVWICFVAAAICEWFVFAWPGVCPSDRPVLEQLANSTLSDGIWGVAFAQCIVGSSFLLFAMGPLCFSRRSVETTLALGRQSRPNKRVWHCNPIICRPWWQFPIHIACATNSSTSATTILKNLDYCLQISFDYAQCMLPIVVFCRNVVRTGFDKHRDGLGIGLLFRLFLVKTTGASERVDFELGDAVVRACTRTLAISPSFHWAHLACCAALCMSSKFASSYEQEDQDVCVSILGWVLLSPGLIPLCHEGEECCLACVRCIFDKHPDLAFRTVNALLRTKMSVAMERVDDSVLGILFDVGNRRGDVDAFRTGPPRMKQWLDKHHPDVTAPEQSTPSSSFAKPAPDGAKTVATGDLTWTSFKGKPFYMLGCGAHGLVFRAIWYGRSPAGEPVAAKAVPSHTLRSDTLQILTDVQHRNVVRYVGFQESVDQMITYLVLELCAQQSLAEVVQTSLLSVPFKKDICKQITSGLAYLHGKKITHRDLKPSNVLLKHRTVKIADFGLAKKVLNATTTCTGGTGSLGFSAPEVVRGERITQPLAADCFSLGVLLHFVLTRRNPFGSTAMEAQNCILRRFCKGTDEDRLSLEPTLSRAAKQLLRWLLQNDQEKRPRNAREIQHDAFFRELDVQHEWPTASLVIDVFEFVGVRSVEPGGRDRVDLLKQLIACCCCCCCCCCELSVAGSV